MRTRARTDATHKFIARSLKAGAVKTDEGLSFDLFVMLCVAHGLPRPEREFTFHPTRKWRFDYAFPDHKLAVEVEGAIWTQGRHTRGKGYLGDLEKYNSAVLHGWKVLRYTPQQVQSGEAVEDVKAVIR